MSKFRSKIGRKPGPKLANTGRQIRKRKRPLGTLGMCGREAGRRKGAQTRLSRLTPRGGRSALGLYRELPRNLLIIYTYIIHSLITVYSFDI